MTTATGLAALWLATGLAVLQMVLAFGSPKALTENRGMIRAVAIVQGGLMVIALAMPMFGRGSAAVAEAGVQLGLANLTVAVALAVSAFVSRKTGRRLAVKMRPWVLAGWLLLTLGITLGSYGGRIPLQNIALAAWVIATAVLHGSGRRSPRQARRASLGYWGATVAHAGFAVAIVGLAAQAGLTDERSVILQPGGRVAIGPWLIQLNSVTPAAGPGWTAIEGEVEASRGSGPIRLEPQLRYALEGSPAPTNEPAVQTFRGGRLGAAIGEEAGGWKLRLWWQPFVTLIWLGGALAGFGGVLVMTGLAWRRVQRRPGTDWRRGAYR